MTKHKLSLALLILLLAVILAGAIWMVHSPPISGAGVMPSSFTHASTTPGEDAFLDALARDAWAYLHSDWATSHHLPWSWRSATCAGGDYDNPAEIGLYALSWLAAYDLGRSWSPSWTQTEAEVSAVLDQLRAWQSGT